MPVLVSNNLRKIPKQWRMELRNLLFNWRLLPSLVELNLREPLAVNRQKTLIQQSPGGGVFKCV